MNYAKASLSRLRAGIKDIYSLSNLDEWIVLNTKIHGKPFSFKDREFQIPILRDKKRRRNVVKCAQVGLSELSYRWAVAACCVMPDFSIIYTFPSSTDAENNNKTRIDPMIDESPEVARLVNPNLNNSSIKQFGRNSFLYFKGTKSETQALSTPADAVINDEYDKSDITNASVYESRLQDKPHKIRQIFSTPTVERYGVSKEALTSNRLRHLATCDHCQHIFLPDYFQHVVVPGWDKPLEEINKDNIHLTKWADAYLRCPRCGKDPNLHHTRMEFVCENSDEYHESNTYYVSPFSAHRRISIPYIVQSSTLYERFSEFKNQVLGITAEEKNESITEADMRLARMPYKMDSTELHCMGCDMGQWCHVTIGRYTNDGTLLIVHKERVPLAKFEERTRELSAQYKVVVRVMDTQPETDLVRRITENTPNAWGAMFVNTKGLRKYALDDVDEDKEEGKLNIKQVKINRTATFDAVLQLIKQGKLKFAANDDDELFINQFQSIKRIMKFDKNKDIYASWEKTDGKDHYHLSTLYLYLACDIRETAGSVGAAGVGIPLVSKVKTPSYPGILVRNMNERKGTW